MYADALHLTGSNEPFDLFVAGADRQGYDHFINDFAIDHRVEVFECPEVFEEALELMIALPIGRVVNISHEVIAQMGLGHDTAGEVGGPLV